jgi:hypothetical protein
VRPPVRSWEQGSFPAGASVIRDTQGGPMGRGPECPAGGGMTRHARRTRVPGADEAPRTLVSLRQTQQGRLQLDRPVVQEAAVVQSLQTSLAERARSASVRRVRAETGRC